MSGRPITIFDETVIAGTVLLPIPFLQSSAVGAAVRNSVQPLAKLQRHRRAVPNFGSLLDWDRWIALDVTRSPFERS
jgi:hypothetical protein